MKLTEEHLQHLWDKDGRNIRLTLEEIMMIHYKRSCRRVYPDSNDPVITFHKALRGSVVVTENEVAVVCNPLDFHLMPPTPGFSEIEIPDSETQFEAGTTIVQDQEGKISVRYKGIPGFCKLPGTSPLAYRWGGEMLFNSNISSGQATLFTRELYKTPNGHGRITTCVEEIGFLGARSARGMKKMVE